MTSHGSASVFEPLLREAETARLRLAENIAATENMLRSGLAEQAAEIAEVLTEALRAGSKLLLFGNGGSAADATHLAAEFVGRFRYDRPALPALSLSDNASSVSAIGNDYGFEDVFARQVAAFGQPGDVAIALSTSGRSANVIEGLAAAHARGLRTVALCGRPSLAMRRQAEFCVFTPAADTARVQECHMLVGHIICEIVERSLFPREAR